MIKTTKEIILEDAFDTGSFKNRVWFDSEFVLDLLYDNTNNISHTVIGMVERKVVEKIGEKSKK